MTPPFSRFQVEGCGICEQFGAEVFWLSNFSNGAHALCYRKISKIEAGLVSYIESIFEDTRERNLAHIKAVGAIRKVLNGVSIETYLETQGSKKLKLTFDSVGRTAIHLPAARL